MATQQYRQYQAWFRANKRRGSRHRVPIDQHGLHRKAEAEFAAAVKAVEDTTDAVYTLEADVDVDAMVAEVFGARDAVLLAAFNDDYDDATVAG